MKRHNARKAALKASFLAQQRGFLPGASIREILQREAERPMQAASIQREPAFESLFGEAHKQAGLF